MFWRRKRAKRSSDGEGDATAPADDTPEPLHARLRRLEADVDDLYDRIARLAGRHARRAQRDAAAADEAAPSPPAVRNGLPSIAQLRASGRLPWSR